MSKKAFPNIGYDDKTMIAEKIYNHLQMFQFYRDLEIYDKTLLSRFLPPKCSLNPNIEVDFLEEWDKDFGGMQNVKEWNLKGRTSLTKDEFVQEFVGPVSSTEEEEPVFGTGIIPNMRTYSHVRYYLQSPISFD